MLPSACFLCSNLDFPGERVDTEDARVWLSPCRDASCLNERHANCGFVFSILCATIEYNQGHVHPFVNKTKKTCIAIHCCALKRAVVSCKLPPTSCF